MHDKGGYVNHRDHFSISLANEREKEGGRNGRGGERKEIEIEIERDER